MKQPKNKSVSIRLRLIAMIVPIVLIIIISFFVLARDVVFKISQEKLQADSRNYAGKISSWTNKILGELEVYQKSIEEGNFADDKAVLEYMKLSLDRNEAYPAGLYMGDDSGVYLDASGWQPDSGWVLTERDWYVDGMVNDKMAFGEPYYDSNTGEVCVSAAVRVNYPKAARVLAVDVYLNYVAGLVDEISAQEEMQAFLVTGNSQTIIAHQDADMMAVTLKAEGIDSLYTDTGKALSEKKDGMITVLGDKDKYYVCINPVENTDWYLITYMTEKKVLSDLYRMEMIMLLIGALAAVILILAVLRVMNRVVKPVAKVTDVIGRIAEGDFSQNLDVKGNDEIAAMSNNMQMFITQMRSTISEISNTADWLNRQSVENEKVSDSLMDSSRKQFESMEILGQMADRLSAAAQEVSEQMDKLSELIETARTQGENADILMQESVVMSQSGKSDMEQINMGMSNISKSITVLSEQMAKAGDATAQISDMVNIIMDIAEETNLLSLNASIEAARAGESGRGFAVVAEQIGKLAYNSSTAADDISRLTSEIQNTVDKAVEQTNLSVEEVQSNVEVVSEASATFEGLYEKVDETSHRVAHMIELVGRVNTVARDMEQITGRQVQATEQIAQSAKELNRHAQKVTTDSNTVAESAEELKKESMELTGRMEQFRL